MKLLVTGTGGLIGSAIKRILSSGKYPYECRFLTREDGDLTKEEVVKRIFEEFKPDYVINTAASVGGMGGNKSNHAVYFRNNTLITTHLIHYAYLNGVKKLLNMSSTCIFPVKLEVFDETMMHEGPPFESHFAYAYAKRLIDVQCRAYENQYGVKNYSCIIPGNVFGPNDSFNLATGHVCASILHKRYLAEQNNTPLEIWGDGSDLREFIFAPDLAQILIDLLALESIPRNILVCSHTEISIKELVEVICRETNFTGPVIWQGNKSNGQRRKKSDTTLLHTLLPNVRFTPFDESIRVTYQWLKDHYPNVRM